MTRAALEYVLTAALALTLAYIIVSPMVNRVAQSMDDSANMIAEAGR
jgi:H+/gluconate symporter-like permease